MREIENKYENMSRVRLHGKHPRPNSGSGTQANGQGVDSRSNGDNEHEDPMQPGTPQGDESTEPAARSQGEGWDLGESDGEDYVPSENGSSDDERTEPDEVTSDLDYDSYGLADP